MPKCVWDNSTGAFGQCAANDYTLLSLAGKPPTESARLLAYAQHRAVLCKRITTEAACLLASDLGCGWDRLVSVCFASDAALLRPEVLQGRLFCAGSLLDQATRCLLLPQLSSSSSNRNSNSSSSSGLLAATTCGADAACSYLTAPQLAAALAAAPAAEPYLRLAALASFNEWPPPEGSGGACVARWLTQPDTLAALGRSATASPTGWLLQPDLVGSGCSSTLAGANVSAAPEMARVRAAVAAAASACQAAGAAGGADGCAAAEAGCDWAERGVAGGGSSSSSTNGSSSSGGTCGVGTTALLDSLFDPNDAWVKALDEMTAVCTARATTAACAAAGSIVVDPARLDTWRDVLVDGGGDWVDGGSGGAGGLAAAQPPPLLRWMAVAAVLVLAGMTAVC
ncbi:hypothetical protein HXX76_014933 [Chlamydomonas incerta]|uniref:Uncharacterized protein n=1 Tax=Chlamydomonas incerta TaxID=51695 RepID=A0A835SBF1_CHLIN|nr:hypothetical protein HXX76_014933 [Chlamydomonas incerta]|eukprot:KAG2423879.1 hypothetical protein HXX76_014933 [Chlamydomonas incerta]